MKNWFDHIMFHTRANPEKPAIVMEDRVVTYAMLAAGIERCACRIAGLNVGGSGPVAVLVENPIRHLVLSFALFRIGIRAMSLEHGQAGIKALKAAAVLGDAKAATMVDPANRFIEATDAWFSEDVALARELPKQFNDSQEICRVSLSSGSTGAPKLIPRPVAAYSRRILRFIDTNWSSVLCMPGLSSNWGFMTSCAALATGRTLCFAQSPFQAVRMIELFSIDFVMASTEQLLVLTHAARKAGVRLNSLRTIWFGGSVPTRALLEAAMIYLCNNIICRYAASEIGLMAQATAADMLAKPGLVGHVVPGVEVAIFDRAGSRCGVGQAGFVRGRLDRDADENLAGSQGATDFWIDFGDIGWFGSDGQLYVAGRVSDLGAGDLQGVLTPSISPVHEVEHLLRLEWDAADAAAVMADDNGAGKEVWVGAVDCAEGSAEKLTTILQTRGLDFNVRLFNLLAIPRSTNGKVNRAQLKALILERMGKAGAA